MTDEEMFWYRRRRRDVLFKTGFQYGRGVAIPCDFYVLLVRRGEFVNSVREECGVMRCGAVSDSDVLAVLAINAYL